MFTPSKITAYHLPDIIANVYYSCSDVLVLHSMIWGFPMEIYAIEMVQLTASLADLRILRLSTVS